MGDHALFRQALARARRKQRTKAKHSPTAGGTGRRFPEWVVYLGGAVLLIASVLVAVLSLTLSIH